MLTLLVEKGTKTGSSAYGRWECLQCDFFCFSLKKPDVSRCPKHPHCEMGLTSRDSLANLIADLQGGYDSPNV